jgi:hypothetical protein
VSTVKSKAPTPQGISALLRKAGFDRAEYKKNWIAKAGYRATKAVRGEGVEVRHDFLLRQSSDARRAMLARYAEAITAGGWSVEVREYDLIVPAEAATGKAAK